MAQAQRVLARDEGNGAERYGRHKLDEMDASRVARHLVMFRPTDAEVADLMARARPSIPGLGKTEAIQNVLRHECGHMFAVARKSRFNPAMPVGEGFILILLLNEIGLLQLALGTINGPDPDFGCLRNRTNVRPGSICGAYSRPVAGNGPIAAVCTTEWQELTASAISG